MTLAEQYQQACNPAKWKILGRTMVDFTHAHDALLNRIGWNPASVSPADLLLAARVCSLSREKAEKALQRGGWTFRDFIAGCAFRFVDGLFSRVALAFQAYINAAKPEIGFWADMTGTRRSSSPPLLMVKRDLMSFYGYSESEVLGMPYGRAEWERLSIMEADGSLEFSTDEDTDDVAQARVFAQMEAAGIAWHEKKGTNEVS